MQELSPKPGQALQVRELVQVLLELLVQALAASGPNLNEPGVRRLQKNRLMAVAAAVPWTMPADVPWGL